MHEYKEQELCIPNLLGYLPGALREIKEFKILNEIISKEIAVLNWYIKDLMRQRFIDYATWGLELWENEYNIETNPSKDKQERRDMIKAKKRGYGTVTKKLMEETAEAFTDGKVKILEQPESNSFTVKFIDIKGTPKNLGDFKEMVNNIKPAHLDVNYEFAYLLVKDIHNVTTINQLENTILDKFAGGEQ